MLLTVNKILKVTILMVLLNITLFVNGLPAITDNGDNSCNCVCGVRGRTNRIVGGNVAPAHEYPWMVGLSKQGKLYCGGSLISRNFVMTAAHCTHFLEPNDIRVYLGGHNITEDYIDSRRVSIIHTHEHFDIFTYDNDIAILKLDRPVQFGPKVQPGCLPSINVIDNYAGAMTIIAGWGRLGEGKKTSPLLRSLIVPVWSQSQCYESDYGKKRISDNMMCAGYHDGVRDACQGDSGGPMHMEGATGSMELIGVTSWGRGCARPNLPGIYTRVVNYLPWIHKKIGRECLCAPKNGVRTNFLENFVANWRQ